jgi:nitrogen fixation protein NifX
MNDVGRVKIALTSNDLIKVDANFQIARQVVFYDVGQDDADFVDCVQFKGNARARKGPGGGRAANGGFCWMDEIGDEAEDGSDPLAARVDALDGCGILFTRGLSDPAAVRVFARKVFPVKMERVREIDEVIASLQHMMRKPPLWLRKALGTHVPHPAYQVA